MLLNLDSQQLAIGEADFITSSQSSAVFAQEPLGLSHLWQPQFPILLMDFFPGSGPSTEEAEEARRKCEEAELQQVGTGEFRMRDCSQIWWEGCYTILTYMPISYHSYN